jgi:transketolase
LATYFNRPGFELFDYDVYALCGDACMMEGISGEAASLAGYLNSARATPFYREPGSLGHEGPTE